MSRWWRSRKSPQSWHRKASWSNRRNCFSSVGTHLFIGKFSVSCFLYILVWYHIVYFYRKVPICNSLFAHIIIAKTNKILSNTSKPQRPKTHHQPAPWQDMLLLLSELNLLDLLEECPSWCWLQEPQVYQLFTEEPKIWVRSPGALPICLTNLIGMFIFYHFLSFWYLFHPLSIFAHVCDLISMIWLQFRTPWCLWRSSRLCVKRCVIRDLASHGWHCCCSPSHVFVPTSWMHGSTWPCPPKPWQNGPTHLECSLAFWLFFHLKQMMI